MTDPKLLKARKVRSTLLGRIRNKYEDLRANTPDAKTIYVWLDKWNGKCHYFGTSISIDKCHVDHKIPISRGGTNEIKNLCITHPRANLVKGDMDDKEFKQFLRMVGKWEDKGKRIMQRLSLTNIKFGKKKT